MSEQTVEVKRDVLEALVEHGEAMHEALMENELYRQADMPPFTLTNWTKASIDASDALGLKGEGE